MANLDNVDVTSNEAATSVTSASQGKATSSKAKKNQSITVQYLNSDGLEVPLGEEVKLLKIITRAGEDVLSLNALPKAMLIAAAAFGLNTTFRNAHNTTEHGGGDGIAAVKARLAGISAGTWRSAVEGEDSSIPLVVEAMIRAKKDAGVYVAGMESVWLDQYRGLDKAAKGEWTKTMAAKKPIALALLKIKAERAAAKAASFTGAGDDSDF